MKGIRENLLGVIGEFETLIAQNEAINRSAIVAFTDLKGTILEVNDMFCQVSGYSRDELIGQNHRILNSGYHDRSFFREMFATVGRGGIWRNEIRNKNKAGGYYWVDTTIAPVRDITGRIVKYMAIRFEITDKKKVEQEKLAALFELKQANEELSQFAYRASHDLKSPISRSRQLVEHMIEDITAGDTGEVLTNADRVVQQLRSLELLVVDILSIAKADLISMPAKEIRFEQMVEAILLKLDADIKESRCEIKTQLAVSNSITGEEARYSQIIYNLMSNGIRYRNRKIEDPYVSLSLREDQDAMVIEVEDNGIGIPEDEHANVFKMFEKFHPSIVDGSGLGLSIVKKHVDVLKGRVHFQSSKKGTTFRVEIPF